MAWHFAFIAYFFRAFGNRVEARDLALDLIGLAFLLAMTTTSFPEFRRKLTPAHWVRLHTCGIHTLWFVPTFFFLNDFHRERNRFYGAVVGILLAALGFRMVSRVVVRSRPESVMQRA